ncbi:MAG: threonylcarbamoyl-AMP synthase [Flavobacteriales bacterium]|nr:threonylcarbamoyl-AMP synthase [Flavobacteriales bacterium]
MAEYLRINPKSPNPRDIEHVANCLLHGGVIIYPTDTVYGLGCDVTKTRAVERVAALKGMKLKDAQLAIVVNDLSRLADYARVETPIFKLMKKTLPGPFTFILNATGEVPKIFQNKKKTIGIRIPNNIIPLEIVRMLGHPITTTSVVDEDAILEYTTDPAMIYENFKDKVDIVIDGGFGNNIPSTIVDCTSGDYEVIRQGLGYLEEFGF